MGSESNISTPQSLDLTSMGIKPGGMASSQPVQGSITGGRSFAGMVGGTHQGFMSIQGKMLLTGQIGGPFGLKPKQSAMANVLAEMGDKFLKGIANTGIQPLQFSNASMADLGHTNNGLSRPDPITAPSGRNGGIGSA